MPDTEHNRLTYTVRELAQALGISERSVYRQIEQGKIAPIQVGGRKLIPASVVRVLLAGKQ